MPNETTWNTACKNIKVAKKTIRELEAKLIRNPSEKSAKTLAHFAIKANASIYYSEALENYYLDLAQRTEKPCTEQPVQLKHFLHVMTRCYQTGGHTRIVERWIMSAPKDETHCVVLIAHTKTEQIPELLKQVIAENGGKLILLKPKDSITEKSNKLRKIALSYDQIILHQHMKDPVPLMAFGLPSFKRPVIMFNHAGHLFWIGRKVTDLVIDIEESQQRISHDKRGISNRVLVNLPYLETTSKTPHTKAQLRKELDLPDNASIVISMASSYKYAIIGDYNYPEMLKQILNTEPNSVIVMIGVSTDSGHHWHALKQNFPERIFMMGTLPYEVATKYLQASDLYLDSYPYNSFTSILDAISIGQLPALSLQTPVGNLPFLKGTEAIASTQDSMATKAVELLNKPHRRQEIHEILKQRITECSNTDSFQNQVHLAYETARSINKDQDRFLPIQDYISDFDILSHTLQRKNSIARKKTKKIGRFILREKQDGIFVQSLSLFGLPIYYRTLIDGHWKTFLFNQAERGKRLGEL